MPIVRHILSFASGEISPLLDGRTDIPKYAGACKRLENFIPTPQGGLVKRPGLQRLGYTASPSAPAWSSGTAYVVDSRVNRGGKTWVAKFIHTSNNGNAPGTGAKLVDPADGVAKEIWRIQPPTFGQLVEFQITTHRSVVLVLAGKRMKFVDRGRMVKESALEGAAEFQITIPWGDTELSLLRWKQVNNVMFLCHPLHHPYQLTRRNAREWTLEKVDFKLNVPLLDENAKKRRRITAEFMLDGNATPWSSGQNYKRGARVIHGGLKYVCRHAHTSSNENDPLENVLFTDPDDEVRKTIWRKSWSDADPDYIDVSAEVGQSVDLTSTAPVFRAGHVGGVWQLAARRGPAKFEVSLEAAESTNNTESKVLVVQGDWSFITYGTWAGVFTIEISSDQGESWTRKQVYRSTVAKPRNASSSGSEDSRVLMRIAYSGYSTGGFSEKDKPYAMLSTPEGRIRGLVKITEFIDEYSVIGEVLSPIEHGTTNVWSEGAWSDHQGFPRCVELHQNRLLFGATTRRPHTIWGSAVDDYLNFKRGTDADLSWVHTLAIGTRDPILWMDSNRTLVVGNGGGEFTLRGENSDSPVTPEFGICDRHSSYGTHQGGAGHIVSDTVSLFVQNGGRALREMVYSFQTDKYESANLNLLAEHLFKGSVQDVAVQRQPFQIIWVVAGGQLFSMTYERSQEIVAWARHPVGGVVIAIGSVRRHAEDGMFFLIRREDRLSIERFVPGGILEPKDGTFLDSHTTLGGDGSGGGGGGGSYEGFYDITDHPLRGRVVCGYLTGQAMKGKVVGPAKLDENFFRGLTGPVTVGLPMRALCQPVTPEVQLENGSSRTRDCRIHRIVPSLYRSRGGKFGQTPSGPLDPLDVGSATSLFTGEVEREFDGGFSPTGDFCLVSDEPHPFTIRSVALKLNYTGDVR